ncbi:MAG: transcriptional repressor LexA [Peptoniphilus sp.]|uniref:transcriptional repressor LexA n=1 Tax=Peptoniphilus sp. TaxID=1971214 RepID=UPI002A765CB0|nr:transcriptional repressor LexA [Peptoniphilus sp.]MDY2986956.1 transcriptional repressor LexA [Peptoniphilus sp.]
MYEDLTQREKDILFYLIQQLQLKGYPPTVREICHQLNIKSTSTVHGSLEKLEIKGYIRKDPTKPRAIEILNNNEDVFLNKKKTIDIPIVGQVSAGAPILAFENIEDTYPLPIEFAQDRNLFILKIVGESMINAGILDGDFVIIEKRDFAKNGDKVLALIGEDSTVKTFYKEKDGFRLQPENDFMESIYVKDLKILGVVVGLYRKM